MELKATDLEIKIGKKNIVKGISLLVKERKFVGLIGPNGCGKSTFLKGIYKSLSPQSGSVFLGSMDVLNSTQRKVSQQLGVVGQFNEMHFDLTVEQMVMLGRTPHKGLLEQNKAKDHEVVDQAIAATNLEDYRKRSYLSLSGGEKQRVILARTIAQQPEFMILDEPTNHLDIRYQIEILSCVKSLGIGILAALHDLETAAHYCDYIYAVKDGTIHSQGRPEDVLTAKTIEELYKIKCEPYVNPITNGMAFAFGM